MSVISLRSRRLDPLWQVVLNVEPGDPPTAFIITPSTALTGGVFKPNANARLQLGAGGAESSSEPLAYLWSLLSTDPTAVVDLSDPTICSTGVSLTSLVILANTLRAGARYTFQLQATGTLSGLVSSATITFSLNAPPYGGVLNLAPNPPYIALQSQVSLTGDQWFDDASDLPLVYAFYYVEALQAADESAWTSLGQETVSNTINWRNPPGGNYTLICQVIDTFGATAQATRGALVETAALDVAAATTNIFASIQSSRFRARFSV